MTGVTGIILAAGLSRRFSGNKLQASFEGEAILCRVARAALASKLDRVIVVLGHQAPEMAEILRDLPVDIVLNDCFQEGQSSSIKAGMKAMENDCRAVMFLVADQPLLKAEVIDALIDCFQSQSQPICHPVVAGQRRNPVIFARSLFAELLALAGDEGGRKVVDAHPGQAALLEFHDFRPFADIDTMDDLKALEDSL